MSILSDFEDRVGRAVEGMFSGVFRSPVQPVELARALARQMDKGRTVGVGKVYAPNLFTVLLSPDDIDRLGGFAGTLSGELATYLVGHAREQGYSLDGGPVVRFLVDEELKLGRFEPFAELVSRREIEEIASEFGVADSPAESPAGIASPPPVSAQAARDPLRTMATVTVGGVQHDIVLRGERMIIGRLYSCDVCVQDANVSREHAAFVAEGSGWALEDLGSTNGTLLNGVPIERERLKDGDIITVGVTELVYHEPGV